MAAPVAVEWTPRLRLLEVLEKRVEDFREALLAAADALAEIQEQKLYREAGFSTFDRYCSQRWSLSHSRAYQLVDWARLRRDIPVESESQARRIAPLWRADPRAVTQAFEVLLGNGATKREAVRELARRGRGQPVNASADTGKAAQPGAVFVLVALPFAGAAAPEMAAANSPNAAATVRKRLEASGQFRKVFMRRVTIEDTET